MPGRGVEADVDGRHVLVGSPRFLTERLGSAGAAAAAGRAAGLAAYVAIDGRPAGVVRFDDQLRPGVAALMRRLRAARRPRTRRCSPATTRPTPRAIGAQAGIAQVEANLLPEDKVRLLAAIEAHYAPVVMVGDGINDAPALATATVGVAMGANGTGISAEAADIVLLVDDVTKVGEAVAIGQRMLRIARQSIFVGLGLSFACMVLASLGLIPPVAGRAAPGGDRRRGHPQRAAGARGWRPGDRDDGPRAGRRPRRRSPPGGCAPARGAGWGSDRRQGRDRRRAARPRRREAQMPRTILVPLDGSALAERALPYAEALARPGGGRLVLVRAVPYLARPAGDKPFATLAAARDAAAAEAREYLDCAAARLGERGIAAEVAVPYEEEADAILAEAQRAGADLIAMATHGRGGLGRWLYGSVAAEVLASTSLPILLIRTWLPEGAVPPASPARRASWCRSTDRPPTRRPCRSPRAWRRTWGAPWSSCARSRGRTSSSPRMPCSPRSCARNWPRSRPAPSGTCAPWRPASPLPGDRWRPWCASGGQGWTWRPR